MRPPPCVLVLLACCCTALAQHADGLAGARDQMGRLVKLAVRDGRLVLDRSAWRSDPLDPARDANRNALAARLRVPLGAVPEALVDEGGCPGGPEKAFEAVFKAAPVLGGGSCRSGGDTSFELEVDCNAASSFLRFELSTGKVAMGFHELTGWRRRLRLEETPDGLTLGIESGVHGVSCLLTCPTEGRVLLLARRGDDVVARAAADFDQLLKLHPDVVGEYLFGPLEEIGILPSPSRFLPAVLAAATSAFGDPTAEVARAVDDGISRLSEEDSAGREWATRELERLYPHAVRKVRQLAQGATDPEVRTRLWEVIEAHPSIAKAIPWVEAQKLHEDRAWLIEVMSDVPAFRASARARLAQLLGRDYGDDPAAWPTK